MTGFKKAERKDIRIKMALAGASGGGKTLGSLLIAKGIVGGDMSKVAVLQTEPGRAQCYVDLGDFSVLEVEPPFSFDKFIEGIDLAIKGGFKVLIIDSVSDEWAGLGGALDVHQGIADQVKNTFSAWKKVTPRHEEVFNKILAAPIHIIATMKKKTDYVMESKNGKQVPRRVGMKDIQREGTEYRWMIQFDLDQEDNLARVGKDNTSLFQGSEPFKITEETGTKIRNWCIGKNEKPK